MSFSATAVRNNGQKIIRGWFNELRTAGLALETFLGSYFIAPTTFTIANTQVAAANVTGLLFTSTQCKSAHIKCTVRRKTTTNEVISSGFLKVYYRDLTSLWEIVDELGGDDDGVVFSITSGGQVQYTSNTVAGSTYVGTIKFKAETFDE